MPLNYLGPGSGAPASRRREVREFTPARTNLPGGSSRPQNESPASRQQDDPTWGFDALSLEPSRGGSSRGTTKRQSRHDRSMRDDDGRHRTTTHSSAPRGHTHTTTRSSAPRGHTHTTTRSLPDLETTIRNHLVPTYVKSGETCIICTNEFDMGTHKAVTVNTNRHCKHVFGRECIIIWFRSQRETSNLCPTGRCTLFSLDPNAVKQSRANLDGIVPEEEWLRQEHGIEVSRAQLDRPRSTPAWEKRLEHQLCEERAMWYRAVGRMNEIPAKWRPIPDAAKKRRLLQEGKDLIRHFNDPSVLVFNYDGDEIIDPEAPEHRHRVTDSTPTISGGPEWDRRLETQRGHERACLLRHRGRESEVSAQWRRPPPYGEMLAEGKALVAKFGQKALQFRYEDKILVREDAGGENATLGASWIDRYRAQKNAEKDWYRTEPDAAKKRFLLAEGKELVEIFGEEGFIFDYSGDSIVVPDYRS
ncbi:uncharacterized protein BDZ99DRAFT_520709 [Mytilinidion resinicola]|uniref:RING-type domain-containing protein n=1 Tax=Mytilinidion resinicola TaxID=574789 RepID=A0A6A6YLB4_9PEZI|nr:uncharacterized protein BDZ99DRAFT_520709 [Mytilinidion resinicola]KAF2809353.1 hypothetical protein BDZ99DRAFT_520709 [Mytilinidion resinicola]